MRFAVKRLSSVEIAPRATKKRIAAGDRRSNQHEFNAGRLRKALGFDEKPQHGVIHLSLLLKDGADPHREECNFTLYDARARKKAIRGPEYRLYYDTQILTALARSGDLIAFFRPDDTKSELIAIVARKNTQSEAELLAAIDLGPESALKQFHYRDPTKDVHPLVEEARSTGTIPKAAVIAQAALDLVARARRLDPDEFLASAMDTETRIFMELEEVVATRKLNALLAEGRPHYLEMMKWAQSLSQARKSRRGQSLQLQFAALLRRERIPFTPQCKTEGGETPDFVVPGVTEYADPKFPSTNLRMVACKSTVKERWGQDTKEAARIDTKYLLTVDDDITAEAINKMRALKLEPFVPENVRKSSYPKMPRPGNVTELINNLRCAVTASTRRTNRSAN